MSVSNMEGQTDEATKASVSATEEEAQGGKFDFGSWMIVKRKGRRGQRPTRGSDDLKI